jgi:hypothetical protein
MTLAWPFQITREGRPKGATLGPWCEGKGNCRSLGLPNFLLVLVALASFMRFSPTENRTRGCVSKQRGRKFGFARDDKGWGGSFMGN